MDAVSRAARIQAGASGPRLERQLARARPDAAPLPAVVRAAPRWGAGSRRARRGTSRRCGPTSRTSWSPCARSPPSGVWESRRLPGSGAGVSPDRMLAGSEGALGVIVEAWVRVQPRPTHAALRGRALRRASRRARECVRALSQSGLNPSNCRLIDPREARLTMVGDGSAALLVLGFESADHPVEEAMRRALELCREHGGEATGGGAARGARQAGAMRWARGARRSCGRRYLRDVLRGDGGAQRDVRDGDHLGALPGAPRARDGGRRARPARRWAAARGQVSCRFTHVYPDGPAPYFTVIAPGRRGEEVEQWAAIKRAVSRGDPRGGRRRSPTTTPSGATTGPGTTASGRSPSRRRCAARRRPWIPQGIMNPGVLRGPA